MHFTIKVFILTPNFDPDLSFQSISSHMTTVSVADFTGLQISQKPERKMLRIPDTMSKWPWRPVLHPLCKEVEEEAKAWLKTFPALANVPRWGETIEVCHAGT